MFGDTTHLDTDAAWNDPNVGSTSGDNSMVPIKLPKLRQLDVLLPNAMALQIYRNCYIPALKRLTFSPYHHTSWEDVDALVAQLAGPQPVICTLASSEAQLFDTRNQSHSSVLAGIEQLCINHYYLDWSTASECIDSAYCNLHQLTSLSLRGTYVPAFINLLFAPTGRRCDLRLPQLKTLAIKMNNCDHPYIRHVCALAWHRKEMGVPLRALIFRGVRRGRFPEECLWWCRENLETSIYFEY
ncbi:hypothetical protein JVT61DRAFT_11814 [Boletus reticuloceps]|uniref:Uncharacterized protein n=1 Tax=Boletus reticuloceps TaxID=495285 RepID=A0A8I2YY68_9AGAM|nr:hypothetical protein JVT61DRAFT_11814 [Boletus reticuloceps]